MSDDVQLPFLPFSADGCPSFLPAAGNRWNENVNNSGSNGNYWSASLNENNSNNAYNLNFNSGNRNLNNNNRNNGFSVRPVTELTDTTNSSFPVSFHISPDELLLDLFRAYKDARRHKRYKSSHICFEQNLEEELVRLRDEIVDRTYMPRPSSCFVISEPKKREIFAADFRDRIVHHLFYNYTYELFERSFIHDSYSCRLGKGTHYGIERLKHHIRSESRNYNRSCFVLKLDIEGYFMHIERNKLLSVCRRTIFSMLRHVSNYEGKTWREVIDLSLIDFLMEKIIMNDPVAGCIVKGRKSDWKGLPANKSLFGSPAGFGLPIGNLTSQLFSNVYLNVLDQFVKRRLHSKHYGRYVDDFYFVSENRKSLRRYKTAVTQMLAKELKLTVHPQKILLCDSVYGIPFLGAYIKPYRTYITNSSLKRMKTKLQKARYMSDTESMRASLNSILGVLSHYDSFNIRRTIFCNLHEVFEYGCYGRGVRTFIPYKNDVFEMG